MGWGVASMYSHSYLPPCPEEVSPGALANGRGSR